MLVRVLDTYSSCSHAACHRRVCWGDIVLTKRALLTRHVVSGFAFLVMAALLLAGPRLSAVYVYP